LNRQDAKNAKKKINRRGRGERREKSLNHQDTEVIQRKFFNTPHPDPLSHASGERGKNMGAFLKYFR
jgi:hypothetical protein